MNQPAPFSTLLHLYIMKRTKIVVVLCHVFSLMSTLIPSTFIVLELMLLLVLCFHCTQSVPKLGNSPEKECKSFRGIGTMQAQTGRLKLMEY